VVPHEALFAKMEQHGIRGRMLGFVRALYATSEIQVLVAGERAPPITLERGLRQGCPASPILFDIFINDLYGRPDVRQNKWGVDIPGVPEMEEREPVVIDGREVEVIWPRGMERGKNGLPLRVCEGRLPGLLFADDLVALAENWSGLQLHAHHITAWCDKWEMAVGIKKCGVMCIGEPGERVTDWCQNNLQRYPIKLCGQAVPVVEEYVYLGLILRRDLDVGVMAQGRIDKAKKGLGLIRPFIACRSIPLAARVTVFRAVVMASLLYGGEIWGMSEKGCNKAQTFVNEALRLMVGAKAKDYIIPTAALWRELQVPPISASVSARRARATNKFRDLKTWVATLMAFQYRPKRFKKLWVASSENIMKRSYCEVWGDNEYKDDQEWLMGGGGRPDRKYGIPGRKAYKTVLRRRWEEIEKLQKHKASAPYLESMFQVTAWASTTAIPVRASKEQAALGRGMRLLALCRLGSLWTAARRARFDFIPEEYKTRCPCCNEEGEGETIVHLLVECSRWDEERMKYMGGLVGMFNHHQLSPEGMCVLLLGGEFMGNRMDHWLPQGGKIQKVNHNYNDVMRCRAFQVAMFLQGVESKRRLILSEVKSLGDSSLQIQSPNG